MRVLKPWAALGGIIVLLCASLLAVGVSTAIPRGTPETSYQATVPPNETDHGLTEDAFFPLWSGDRDNPVPPAEYTSEPRSAIELLADGTDIPLNEPPAAVEQWNRGDLSDAPYSTETSVHPPDAALRDAYFLRDVTVNIFAVQPSTRARLTAGETPLYVGRSGEVLTHVDYRLLLDDGSGETVGDRVYFRLRSVDVAEIRLLANETLLSRVGGSRTSVIPFEDFQPGSGRPQTLTVEADVEATVTRYREECDNWNFNDRCTDVVRESETLTETVTVSDSIEVVSYDLDVSGFRTAYLNGDRGFVVYKNQPWLGYSHRQGSVSGVWRFYSARDSSWDSLVASSADGQRSIRSPLNPLQVVAYPIETGPTPESRRNLTIIDVYGDERLPPALPSNVNLDALTDPYTASYGIATRVRTNRTEFQREGNERPTEGLDSIVGYGLVRGVTVTRNTSTFSKIPHRESNLTLTVLDTDEDEETVRVQLSLRDNSTGEPIATADREGYVILAGERLNTSTAGTVTRDLPIAEQTVSARYVPGQWWRDIPAYTADSTVLFVRGTALAWFESLYRLGIPVSLFLFGVFLIDRLTGWRVWPPWRWL